MAGSEENLLSPGHLNGTNVNFFNIYRNLSGTIHQRSRMMRLQQRCQELKNRESAARHHNQQLLQQFNRAQDTLREMMATTAAMKTIRMEYELFLESSPYRQKQLKEKAQIHHRKRMEEYLKMSTTSVGKPLYSHSCSRQTQRDAATKAYDGQGGSYPPYMECLSSHSYSDRTIAASVFPPTLLPCPQSFQLQHLIATPSHPQCRPSQNTPGCTPSQAKSPRSSVVSDAEDTEISSSSRRKSSHLSQELDFKPVRLSSHHVENGDSSGTESRQVKSKKKRRKTNTSSDRDRSSSKESSTRSSSAAVAQTSESEASSHQGSTSRRMRRNIGGLVAGLPLTTKSETEDKERRGSRSVSESQTEDTASQSPSNQSESSSGDNSPSQSEESSGGSDMAVKGKDNEKLEEEADSKSDGNEEESNMEEDNEDEEMSPEDEREHKSDVDQGCDDISDKLDKEKKKTDLALLQDEHKDEDERDDDDVEEEEDESDAEEQKSEAEERDADDIISPQQRKPRVHFIPQEGSEDDGKVVSRTGTSKDSSELGDDDIEDLLAPQPQTNIRRKGHEAVEEPKGRATTVVCNVEIFQADQQTDSDEFDHFYD
ncbi:protein starmaker-like isoform X2 [Phyllopteryx taeniolatus]|uniref:protein starmaker-like isoform X2 n=1 Tax=Phyllopteryx taeniolatus TaxID=161469 RepID=UPI002AD58CAE|nr:protein starmaker-like isoform X2 [Phyllopteryx taeniolatus]XP_061642914.1 protein starmaker-like isoform X2 [Phyllopteryx taeniolatus]